MTRSGHKSHCHKQHTKLGTKCSCQHHSSHTQTYLAPDSTDECIVFEYDKAKHKWKKSDYLSSKAHQERARVEEIESFLNEINEPIGEWSKKYQKVHDGSGIYLCITIFLIILLPLFFIFNCWFNCQQDKAKEKLQEAKKKAFVIIKNRRDYFAKKQLTWQVPDQFPQWIELWLDEEKEASEKRQEMVGYEKSGYPKSPQGNKVVPIGEQQQLMYNANMYNQAQEK